MEYGGRPRDRDSHDLSAVQLNRFSVVDSMLLSLAGFPGDTTVALPSSHDPMPQARLDQDASPYVSAPQVYSAARKAGRSRAHTHSSSMSDYDAASIDDLARSYSTFHAQAHTRLHAPLPAPHNQKQGRADSARDGSKFAQPGDKNTPAAKSRRPTGHSKRGSRGSNGSSLDMGPPNSSWAHEPGRAASFDHAIYDGGLRNTPKRAMRPPPLSVDPDLDFEAAPTPTVPAGPRRHRDTISQAMAPPPPVTPRKSGPSRQASVKSSRTLKKGKSSQFQDSVIRDQAKQFVNASNNLRNGHAAATGSAPSPTVGSRGRATIPSPAAAQNQPKEQRPGFFRRVFGSSKHQNADELPAPVRPSGTPKELERPKTQPAKQHSTQSKGASRPPTQDTHTNSRGDMGMQPPTLRKSSSSFFRRRKKSMGGNEPPPMPPLQILQQHAPQSFAKLHLGPQLQGSESQSSLRNVMAPYLADNTGLGYPQDHSDSQDRLSNGPFRSGLEISASSTADNVSALQLQEEAQAARLPVELDRSHGATAEMVFMDGESSMSVQPPSLQAPASKRGPVSKELGRSVASLNLNDSPSRQTFLADSSISDDASRVNTTSSADMESSVRMPTRPAPHPSSSPSYLQTSRNMEQAVTKDSEDPYLSPISDHSYHETDATRILDEDQEFIISQITTMNDTDRKSLRVWLEPTASDERLDATARLSLPIDGPRTSGRASPAVNHSDGAIPATSLPTVQVENNDAEMDFDHLEADKAFLSTDLTVTDQDRDCARKIFDGDESFVSKAGAASWLGQTMAKNARTRTAYMELFDWRGVNILQAFRDLCERLVVRAESQQLDRVIDAFSERWCECNQNHGFRDRDVVHTITFSILMLNTDLHLADMDQRMTKSQFVKNTLPTIRNIADAAVVGGDETVHPSSKTERGAIPWEAPPTPTEGADRPSLDVKRSWNRQSKLPVRSDSEGVPPEGNSTDGCNFLVHAPYEGSMRGWENQVELVLKEFYNSIRSVRLPLHGAGVLDNDKSRQPSNASLAVITSALRRTPSVLSKTPSDNISYRGRPGEMRSATARFSSKSRTRRNFYPNSNIGSSRTSLDDQSLWSPAASTWTKHSIGKTQTSFSVESLGSWGQSAGYQQAIGFANALSQAIIREEGGAKDGMHPQDGSDMGGRIVPLLEDESLGLHGPPWAKEGSLFHKHLLEAAGKKAKDRGWAECFAVVEKGQMRLFSFSSQNSHSTAKGALRHLRHHHKPKASAASGSPGAGQVFGGGNWTENAEALDNFTLRQTIANVLPTPGYSKTKPHVWVLSLPSGAVHLFSVGSTELSNEWVSSSNYWSARLSKEPLVGGVSNVEYGWGENIIASIRRPDSSATNTIGSPPATAASTPAVNEYAAVGGFPTPGSRGSRSGSVNNSGFFTAPTSQPRSSIHQAPQAMSSRPPSSLGRGSIDQGHWGNRSARLPGDKAVILEWRPPAQSMMASQLMEVDQRNGLQAYVTSVEEELKRHNELRGLVGMAFSPRHPNATKAMTNWEKKSAYLLKEIVKFSTYIDALTQASAVKDKLYAERAETAKLRKTVADELDDGEQEQQHEVEQALQREIVAGGDLEEDNLATADVNMLLQGQERRLSNGSAEEDRGLERRNTAMTTS